MRPQIKRTFPIYWLDDETLRIGAQQGLTKELTDPKGELRQLIPLLDGTRDASAIIEEMQLKIDYLTEEDIILGISQLDSVGLVEDASLYDDLPLRLTANQSFFAAAAESSVSVSNDAQRILRQANIVLLGLGGGGSATLPQLLSLGPRKLTIVDYDVVDESNLNRQTLYRESDVGRKKSEVAAEYSKDFAPDCQVDAIDVKVTSAREIVQLSRDADIVLCAIDEPPFIAQRRANYAAVQLGIPLVIMLTQHTSGRFFSVVPHRSGCMDCLHIFDELNTNGFLEQFRALMNPAREASTAIISPHIQRLTSFAVDEAVRLLTGYAPPLGLGKQVEVDYLSGHLRTIMEWEVEPGCPTCGSHDPRFDYIFEADPL